MDLDMAPTLSRKGDDRLQRSEVVDHQTRAISASEGTGAQRLILPPDPKRESLAP